MQTEPQNSAAMQRLLGPCTRNSSHHPNCYIRHFAASHDTGRLFSSVNVLESLFLTSGQCGSVALNGGSLHGKIKMRCCQLQKNSEETSFRM
jgi:hypothetical protein